MTTSAKIQMPVHSPVHSIRYTTRQHKTVCLDMKRDDLIHPYISGNKWRKLNYHLQAASDQKKNELLSFGGAWSNHLLAVAFAAAQFGFHCRGLVRGEPVLNPLLQLCVVMGMKLEFVSRSDYRDKASLGRRYQDKNTYIIPEGGYSELGARGCGELLDELDKPYTHLFCACGTGTTLAGLAHAASLKQSPLRLHGIPVLKQGAYLHEEIQRLYAGLNNYELHNAYHFGGYGKTTPALHTFVQDFSRQTGVLIEPTYTGKALYAVFDLLESGELDEGDNILFLHTGGLIGMLGHLDKLVPPKALHVGN